MKTDTQTEKLAKLTLIDIRGFIDGYYNTNVVWEKSQFHAAQNIYIYIGFGKNTMSYYCKFLLMINYHLEPKSIMLVQ